MNIEDYREYCISKSHVTESFPFDDKVLVFKVGGKMFALCNVEDFSRINLKCDPDRALELRESFAGIYPGYHMSKKHWNSVEIHSDVPLSLVYELIDHSYELIVKGLPAALRKEIQDKNKGNP